MINQRIFSANVGDISTGQAGPDAIEQDIENLLANDQKLLDIIGNKANLKTTDKTDLVAAINEHETRIKWKELDFKTEADKPSTYPSQQTTIFIATQLWQGVANLIIRTEKYNNNVAIQYLQPNGSLSIPVMYRLAIPDLDTWAAWEKIATNKQPNWITATLQNGWSGTLRYRKNNIGQLELKGNITAGTVVALTTIATIPIPTNGNNSVIPVIMLPDGAFSGRALFWRDDGILQVAAGGGIIAAQAIQFDAILPIL